MKPQDRTRAILTSRVELSLRMVLVVLADYMSESHEVCWPSVESVAERAGLCERQAREVLNSAEARGIIRRVAGEHKSRDITINWTALAAAEAPSTSRGGARPAKTAASPAKTAGESSGATGKDCHPDRQSLPPQPAKTAAVTGKDCPRSDHEATIEATSEGTIARAPDPTTDRPTAPARSGASTVPRPEPCVNSSGRLFGHPQPSASTASTASTSSTGAPRHPVNSESRPHRHSPLMSSGNCSTNAPPRSSPASSDSTDPDTMPTLPWLPRAARDRGGHASERTARMVLTVIEALRGQPVNPMRCGTDAKTLLGIWKAEGYPDPLDFGQDVILVIEWARDAKDPAAARDIRAEGWADGSDRHRDLSTLTRREKWADRLDRARRWDAAGRVEVRRPQQQGQPPKVDRVTRTLQEMAAEHHDFNNTLNHEQEINPWLLATASPPPRQSSTPLDSPMHRQMAPAAK